MNITRLERRTKAGLVPSLLEPAWTDGLTADRHGYYAEVRLLDPETRWPQHDVQDLFLSRMDGEGGWTIDAAFTTKGYPLWANGYGARYLVTRPLAADLAAQLDNTLAMVDAIDENGEVFATYGHIQVISSDPLAKSLTLKVIGDWARAQEEES